MTEEKMAIVLKSEPQENLFYQALMMLIGIRMNDEAESAFLPNLDDGSRHYNAGRAAAIVDLIESIKSYRA